MEPVVLFVGVFLALLLLYLFMTLLVSIFAMRKANKRMKQLESEMSFEDDFFNR